MNTKEISVYLKKDLICRKIFYGVYPANKILKLRSLPALIVCNTETSSRLGSYFMLTRTIEANILTGWVDFRLNGLKHFEMLIVPLGFEMRSSYKV